MNSVDISRLSDDELWDRTKALALSERIVTLDLVEHLAEIDKRKLPEARESISLYEFCVHHLRLSEEAAYRRIRAARAIKKFPPILHLLRGGRLTVETVALMNPFLDGPDAAALVTACLGLRKWQVQALLANRQTEKPRRDVIRYCGAVVNTEKPRTGEPPALDFDVASAVIAGPVSVSVQVPVQVQVPAPAPPPLNPAPEPVARVESPRPSSVRVSFSADDEFYKLMLRARALLRHKYPDGRLEGVLKDALIALLRKRDRSFGWREPSSRGKK